MKRNIILTGFMGVGKTTVGKILADRIGFSFVDTDDLLIETYSMPIAEVFEKYGEAHFRKTEKEIVKNVAKREKMVVATGGGVVKDPENMALLQNSGVVIYLSAGVDKIMKNIGDNHDRPLLRGKTPAQVAKLMQERAPFYENCDHKVVTDSLTASEIAEEIIKLLERNK